MGVDVLWTRGVGVKDVCTESQSPLLLIALVLRVYLKNHLVGSTLPYIAYFVTRADIKKLQPPQVSSGIFVSCFPFV